MKLTIGRKLGLGFGLVLILLFTVSMLGVVNVNKARTFASDVQEVSAVMMSLHQTNENLLSETIMTYHYFSTGEEEHLTMVEESHNAANTKWENVTTRRSKDYPEKIQAVEQAHAGYDLLLEASIAVYQENPSDITAAMLSMNEASQYFHMNVIPAQEALHMMEMAKVQELVLGVNRMLPTAIILGVIALVVSTGAAYFIGQGIVSAATHLREAAESISRGNLDVPINVTTGDEMEDLAGSLERMRASLKLAVQRLQSKRISRKSE